MLDIVLDAACTTHTIKSEKSETRAAQMFIFQNDRGKDPTDLEKIKAKFMYAILRYGGEEKKGLMGEIRERFETIYTAISSIDGYVRENDILRYTLLVHFDSLEALEGKKPLDKIEEELKQDEACIIFIKEFTQGLEETFEYLKSFYGDDQENIEIHSLINLGVDDWVMPFIIKAYKFELSIAEICQLCKSLESLLLRHKLIRANNTKIAKRMRDVYREFNNENTDISPIIEWVNELKEDTDKWWGHWNNEKLHENLQGKIYHPIAKFLLWKYENHLRKFGQKGYGAMRFDVIKNPHLEHIAPRTENEKPEAGYPRYTDKFKKEYLDCLGNYLLISRSHNISIGNKPFAQKLESYNGPNSLAQQREVVKMVEDTLNPKWTRGLIDERHWKIVEFILNEF